MIKSKRLIIVLIAVLIIVCVLVAAYSVRGSKRVKSAWLASYPALCPGEDLSVIPMPFPFPGSYLLKCEFYSEAMDYANPLVVVNTRDCTATLYMPNLSLPGEYLGKFTTARRMPICP
jgi:hypothetical protein